MIVIQGGMIRFRRRGYQCVGRQRVCVRTKSRVRGHQTRRRKPVEITEKSCRKFRYFYDAEELSNDYYDVAIIIKLRMRIRIYTPTSTTN